MNNDVITNYTKYINNSLIQFFRIILGNDYSASIVRNLVNKYIEVRYYNDSIYEKEADFVTRISKELNLVAKEMLKEMPDQEELIKNITALFGYVLYFDDCIMYDDFHTLCDALFNDDVIKIKINEDTKKKLLDYLEEVETKKGSYFELFETKNFELDLKKLDRHLFSVDIKQYCKVSKLYSDYAVERAYNTGTLNEDKVYLLLVMLSFRMLCSMINFEYHDCYFVTFPTSLLKKPKKIMKYLMVLDNDYVKDHVHLTFTYQDFLDNPKEIKKLIREGYKVAVILDNAFKMVTDTLVIFSYCLVFKDALYYDSLMDIKDSLQTKIIEI